MTTLLAMTLEWAVFTGIAIVPGGSGSLAWIVTAQTAPSAQQDARPAAETADVTTTGTSPSVKPIAAGAATSSAANSLAITGKTVRSPATPVAERPADQVGSPVRTRVDLGESHYFIEQPAGSTRIPLPLVICLHGTGQFAQEALDFWIRQPINVPHLFVAPQGTGAAWRDLDAALLAGILDDVRNTRSFDPRRVLLVGHSAGGAMAMHAAFVDAFPCTALAVTSAYAPPSISTDQLRQRLDLDIFMAVSPRDRIYSRAFASLRTMRKVGLSVEWVTPPTGHGLVDHTGDAVITWFESHGREQLDRVLTGMLHRSAGQDPVGDDLLDIADLLSNAMAYPLEQRRQAAATRTTLERDGRRMLLDAHRKIERGQIRAARKILLDVEQRYLPADLGFEARSRRAELEAAPAVQSQLRPEDRAGPTDLAERGWHRLRRLADHQRIADVRREGQAYLRRFTGSPHCADVLALLAEIEMSQRNEKAEPAAPEVSAPEDAAAQQSAEEEISP